MARTPSLTDMIGLRVSVTTLVDSKIDGDLFAYDPRTGMIVLQVGNRNTPKVRDFHVLKVNLLKSIEVGPRNEDSSELVPFDLPAVNMAQAEEKEREVLQEINKKVGRGVSQTGLLVFEGLSRTSPCEWRGQTIVVYDKIYVNPPYTAESTDMPLGGDQSTLDRVKLVVEKIREKIEQTSA